MQGPTLKVGPTIAKPSHHRPQASTARASRPAVGTDGYTAMQLALILGENNVKLVPDVAVSGDGSSGLANAMIARLMAAGATQESR